MIDHPCARMAGVLGGLAFGVVALLGSALIAFVARPPLWLDILIFLWAMPPALMGLGCAAEILAILSNKLFDGSSNWKWMDDRSKRRSRQSSW